MAAQKGKDLLIKIADGATFVTSGLVAGHGTRMLANNSTAARLFFSAEL